MATIKSENFDGVTAPAMPAGWVYGAGIVTQASRFNSSPNAVENPVNVTVNIAYWDTDTDGNGGNARASHVAWATALNIEAQARIYCRMTTPATVAASTEVGYYTLVTFTGDAISLVKAQTGAQTILASRTGPTLGTTDKYRIFCETVNSTITARLQRLSDSKWLDSSNAWQVAQQDYLTATDTSISGAGKAGIGLRRFNSSDVVTSDDFLFESVGSPPVTRRRVSDSFL